MSRTTTALVYGLAILALALLAKIILRPDPTCADSIEAVERTLSYELVPPQIQAHYDECKTA